LKTAQQI